MLLAMARRGITATKITDGIGLLSALAPAMRGARISPALATRTV